MLVTVLLQRYRGAPIPPRAVDSPSGRLRLVRGDPPYAELLDEHPKNGEEPKILLPRLWKYEVTLEKRTMLLRGLERVGDAVHYQEWKCLIRPNQQGSDWP